MKIFRATLTKTFIGIGLICLSSFNTSGVDVCKNVVIRSPENVIAISPRHLLRVHVEVATAPCPQDVSIMSLGIMTLPVVEPPYEFIGK